MDAVTSDTSVVGAVGDWASSWTIPGALAGAASKIWMCSGGSTSSTLSDKSNFPYFFRTVPDDPQEGKILAYFMKQMGWGSAAVISSSDAYGQSVGGAFMTWASSLGIAVATSQVFQPGQPDFSIPLSSVLDSGSQIIILSALAQDSISLLQQARAMNMIGPKWVWLGPEAFSAYTSYNVTAADISNVDGMLYVFPKENSYNSMYNASVTRWTNAYPNRQVAPYSFLYQDCVTAVAKGILRLANAVGGANVISRNYQPDLAQYFLNNVFTGVSGDVSYDSNGNRLAYYSIFNWYQGTSRQVYEIRPDLSMTELQPILYYDGSRVPPRDRPEQVVLTPTWTTATAIGLAAANGVLALFMVATLGFLTQSRHTSAVRAMGYPFLMLIGYGCLLVLVSNILSLGTPTAASCNLSLWLFTYGVQMTLASSTAKAYRLWKIFDNKVISVGRVSNLSMFMGVAAIMLGQTVILLVWSIADGQAPRVVSARTYLYTKCSSASQSFDVGLSVATLVYNFLLLCVLTALAYKTRTIASNFRESSFLFYVSQNTLLSALVIALFSFFQFNESALAAFVVRQIMVIYAVAFAFACLVARVAIAVMQTTTAAKKSSMMSTVQQSHIGDESMADGGGSINHAPHSAAAVTTATGAAKDLMKVSFNDTTGAVTAVRGTYPVKRTGGLFSTWHTSVLALHLSDGYLVVMPASAADSGNPGAGDVGSAVRLAQLFLDPRPPGLDLCVELSCRGARGFLVQFPTAEEQDQWVEMLSGVTVPSPHLSNGRGGASGGGSSFRPAVRMLRNAMRPSSQSLGKAASTRGGGGNGATTGKPLSPSPSHGGGSLPARNVAASRRITPPPGAAAVHHP
ncbi:periplasmic binding protein-like I [Blastocladiella britannica]|nr:periplasmic binding protein-like I [Blastocladiella britannica]